MGLFLDFLMQQWVLTGALITCVFLLLNHESRKGGEKLSPQQLVNRVNRDQAVVVDVRDAKEFAKGHIVDALNVPHSKVADHLGELEKHKSQPIILVCKMGQHSSAVGKVLAEKGFEKVYRLGGGLVEWQNLQLPLVKS
jgi:rhodanese-related sulfurtransferase